MEQASPPTPVSACVEVDTAAPDQQVWSLLADIASWPTEGALRG